MQCYPLWQHFDVKYFFERTQAIKFEVYDADSDSNKGPLDQHDFIGATKALTLAQIVVRCTWQRL
jgi:hypothetical protein